MRVRSAVESEKPTSLADDVRERIRWTKNFSQSFGGHMHERADEPRKGFADAGSSKISPSNDLVYACQCNAWKARVVKRPSVVKDPGGVWKIR